MIAVGESVKAKVIDIKKFGAFVKLDNGEEGFIHISKISKEYVKDVGDYLQLGQEIDGKVIGTTKDGKYELTLKEALTKQDEPKSNEDFEKKLQNFLKDSEKKISEYNRHLDKKAGRRR